jgi:hypothetical protein
MLRYRAVPKVRTMSMGKRVVKKYADPRALEKRAGRSYLLKS